MTDRGVSIRFCSDSAQKNINHNNEENMESLALTHSFVAYESPESELKLKSLDELGLKIPNAAWVGVVGMAVALSVVSVPGEAQAGGCYRRCGGHHRHHSYAQVTTNGGRLISATMRVGVLMSSASYITETMCH